MNTRLLIVALLFFVIILFVIGKFSKDRNSDKVFQTKSGWTIELISDSTYAIEAKGYYSAGYLYDSVSVTPDSLVICNKNKCATYQLK